jgi:hypothetical protein
MLVSQVISFQGLTLKLSQDYPFMKLDALKNKIRCSPDRVTTVGDVARSVTPLYKPLSPATWADPSPPSSPLTPWASSFSFPLAMHWRSSSIAGLKGSLQARTLAGIDYRARRSTRKLKRRRMGGQAGWGDADVVRELQAGAAPVLCASSKLWRRRCCARAASVNENFLWFSDLGR